MRETISYQVDRRESMMRHTQLYRMKINEPVTINGVSFSVGDVGGLVEHPNNIINSWVEDGAIVAGNAVIKDCTVRKSCYIVGDVHINGNGHFIGGTGGDVILNGEIKLDLQCSIDMGPITLTGEATLTGVDDILSICGLFENKGYGGHLTAYRCVTGIFCYTTEIGLCKLEDLVDNLMVDESIFINSDTEYLKKHTQNIVTMIQSFFA